MVLPHSYCFLSYDLCGLDLLADKHLSAVPFSTVCTITHALEFLRIIAIIASMTLRILAGILLLISIFWLPFWCTIVYALFCLYYFASYYEVFPAFLLVDLVYGTQETRFLGFGLVGLAIAFVFFFGMELLKKKLRK